MLLRKSSCFSLLPVSALDVLSVNCCDKVALFTVFYYGIIIEILFRFYRFLVPLTAGISMVSAVVRSRKLCGNVDNSYIIPVSFLYRYSYIS